MRYRATVKRMSVSIYDEAYRKARRRAAVLDTSVSALVRKFLQSLASEESDFERRKNLQAEVLEAVKSFRARDHLSREKVHR